MGLRPQRRVICVLAPLSSTNTSRSAGTPASRCGQAFLCSATSGRDCSLACSVFFTAPPQPGKPQVDGGSGPLKRHTQFRQRGIRVLLQQLEKAGFAGGGQERLASAQVSLRLEGAAGLEVLADPPHGCDTVTKAGGDLRGALALFVELQNPFTNRQRYSFHVQSIQYPSNYSYIIYVNALKVRNTKNESLTDSDFW